MAQATDAVWLPVLPAMDQFGPTLAKGAGKEAEKQGKPVGQRYGKALLAGVAVVAGGAAASVRALYGIGETFDEVTDTIRVGTGATGDDLEALVDSAKNVGRNVPAEFEAVGTMIGDVNTRLGLTGDTLEKFAEQALEAGRMMGEEIDIKAMSQAFNVFDIQGEDTTSAMDHLYRVSQATGVGMNELAGNVADNAPAVQALGFSFEETASLVGNLDKAGLNSSRMMAGMSRSLVNLAKDGEEPAEAFERTVSEIEGFLEAGDQAAAIDLAGEVFGTRNASQFIGAIEGGTLAMDDLAAVSGMTEDTILEAGEETMDFAEKWQMFRNDIMTRIEPAATKLFDAIGDGMDWISNTGVPALKDFGTWLQRNQAWLLPIAAGIGAIVVAWGSYRAVMGIVQGVTKAYTAVQAALNAVMMMNPIGIVVLALVGLTAAFVVAYKKSETFRNIVDAAWAAIKDAAAAAWDWIKGVFKSMSDGLTRLGDWWKTKVVLIQAYWDGFKTVLRNGWDWIDRNVFAKFREGLTRLGEAGGAFKDTFKAAWDGLKAIAAKPINFIIETVYRDGIKRVFDKVAGAVGLSTRLPVVSSIPTRARGGYTPPGWTLVGEEGPELVNFTDPNRVYTAAETARALSMGRDLSPSQSRAAAGGSPAEAVAPMGGFWSSLGDAVKSAVSWVRGGLASMAGAVLTPLRTLMNNTLGNAGSLGKIAAGAGGNAIDGLVDWIRGKDDEGGSLADAKGRPSAGPITSRYGPRWGGFHAGIDIAGGGPTYAIADGVVQRAGWNILSGRTGIGALIKHGSDYTYYGHNPVGGLRVGPGDLVKQGQRIGAQGATGNVTGTHLHFEYHKGRPGNAVNPESLGIFDKGGRLDPGMLAYHSASMRKPDAVLTDSQWSDMHRIASERSASGDVYVQNPWGPEYMRAQTDERVEAGLKREVAW